jgi:hypothetical protein
VSQAGTLVADDAPMIEIAEKKICRYEAVTKYCASVGTVALHFDDKLYKVVSQGFLKSGMNIQ